MACETCRFWGPCGDGESRCWDPMVNGDADAPVDIPVIERGWACGRYEPGPFVEVE